MTFQIDSICSQKTDAAILAALKDLPKDLPGTFDRILRKLQHSDTADSRFCKKIFDVVAAAQRPLTLEELREAVSVEPGETKWDASKLVNDMLKSLLESCGSLLDVDEEHLTVHFAHHSVKQYLLSEPRDSDLRTYHIDTRDADLYLGDVIVTYLNLGLFDQRLTKANSPMLPQVPNYPSAILGSLPGPDFASKWAMKLLKSRGDSRLDIHSQLKTAAGIVGGSKEQTQPAHPFLSYAQEYWLFHTKVFHPSTHPRYPLWQRLINEEVKAINLPWAPKKWDAFGDEYMKWVIQNKHWALIDESLVKLNSIDKYSVKLEPTKARQTLLNFLEKNATDMNFPNLNLDVVLYLASFLNNKTMLLLLLRKGANVNAEGGYYGNALQVASRGGLEEIARSLLENGADVNVQGGYYGNALQAASFDGHEKIARLLLENGANVNAEGGYYGNPLQAASRGGHEEILRLLLENGANVNAEGGFYGNALHAASFGGHEKTARLLLENGANVNAEGGFYGNALQAASREGHEEIVRLLLENGANVNAEGGYYGNALQAASSYGREEIARLLLENGANVNAKGGRFGTSLEAAMIPREKALLQLLLDNGAIVDNKTMKAASVFRGDMKRLIRNVWKSQSLSVRNPTSTSGGEPSRSSR